MTRALVAVLLVAAAQQPATWRAIDLRAKDTDIDGRSCRWDAQAGSTFRRAADGRVEVNCGTAAAAAVLQCDPQDVEPRDIAALSLCGSPVVDFDAARTATVVPSAPADFAVTWLRAPEAPALETRAVRAIAAQDRFSILVADDTFVRFAPPGASPRTVSAGTLVDRPLALRVDASGGEIFARSQRARVAPDTLEVLMAGRRAPLTYRSAWFSLPEQAPGQYQVTRVYPGGVRTAPVPVTVRASRTTDVWLPAERVGGVRVVADSSVCLSDSVFELVPIAGLSDKPIVSSPSRACRWTIGGLAPGEYRARVMAEPVSGVPAEADFTVTSQEWSDVELNPPPVVVRGRILILGRPAAKREVRFAGDDPPAAVVVPDDEGRYVVGLRSAGAYEVSLDASPLGYRTYDREFTFGENHYDLDIRGALLRIRITQAGERPKGPVTLTIRGPRETIQRVITSFDRPLELDGLPYGVYVVSATASGGLQSLDYAVTLSEGVPSALVWVDVSRERRVLRVETETGMPVAQATIVVSGGASQSLRVPTGIFPLPPLAVLTPIVVIAPGFSPTCIIVTGANEERATMVSRIAPVELRFPRSAPGQPVAISADLYGIPWASCPVPIERVGGEVIQRAGYDAVILKLPIGQMQIDRQGVRTIFDVPGFPVIVR